MVEFGRKNMNEKVQDPNFQIQEYIFVEAHKSGSSDRYKSRNDLYTRYGQDKSFSSEKRFEIFL